MEPPPNKVKITKTFLIERGTKPIVKFLGEDEDGNLVELTGKTIKITKNRQLTMSITLCRRRGQPRWCYDCRDTTYYYSWICYKSIQVRERDTYSVVKCMSEIQIKLVNLYTVCGL